jgi:hypothetical protein
MKGRIDIFLLILISGLSCREPFSTDFGEGENNFLVVEGYINTGPGATTIKLSRTAPIDTEQDPAIESGAVVMVEDENSTQYILEENEGGIYSGELNLPETPAYRVHIFAKDGKEYVSDFQASIVTPPIDSLTWRYAKDGVTILLSTHDASNLTRYYQFEYEETWEIHAFYSSLIKYQGKQLVPRTTEEIDALYQCWKSSTPSDLILHSTAQQASDVTIEYPLVFIPINTERLNLRYSILVKQHALSPDVYRYLQLMKKNTGPLGSFSDPQPSELYGNIHCTTTDELVVGYVGVSSTAETRIFINRWDLIDWSYSLQCGVTITYNHPDTLAKYLTNGVEMPTVPAEYGPSGEIIQFFRARDICVDCRRVGGQNVKPEFWD